ncbi:MAG: hypothetical protein HY303_15955 [Candidatus Wallbacteria bacterium]|nr:hypothetical protein [Candidatus Wallbacteria bacterium]
MNAISKNGSPSPWLKALLSGWLAWHLMAIALAAIPLPEPARARLLPLVKPYLLWTGCWELWDMFAPNPPDWNTRLEAVVTFQDGSQSTFDFARPELLPPARRFLEQLQRQWKDRLLRPEYAAALPDAAQYVARLHAAGSRRPVRVRLRRISVSIPPPEAAAVPEKPRAEDLYTLELPAGEAL